MNEFIILLENAAGAGWVFLVAIAATAVGLLVFDRKRKAKFEESQQSTQERRAA